MATETRTRETAYDGRLFRLYTKYVSEPESKKDVYGYTLLVTGYILALLGMVVFLAGSGLELDPLVVRRVAGFPAAVGLVLTLLGIVLMLPVALRGIVVAVLGALVALAATVAFVIYYPYNWHLGTPSYSTEIVTAYGVGTALVAGVVIMVPIVTGKRSYFTETSGGPKYEHPKIMVGEADRGGLFALFKRGTEWTWRFIDQSAVAASTGTFLSRLEAEDRVEAIKEEVAGAGLLEIKHAAFRLYESASGTWQWYLMREDGSVTAEAGEDYASRDAAEGAINAMKDHGPDADVFVLDDAVFEYERVNGEWRWRLVDEDRSPLATSADTYPDHGAAHGGIEAFRERAEDALELVIESYGVELEEIDGGWIWHLRDSGNRWLAQSAESYGGKGEAEDRVYDILDRIQRASILEAATPTYDVYDDEEAWHWRLLDEAGTTVGEAVDRVIEPETAERQARRMQSDAQEADVVHTEDLEFESYRAEGGWRWRLVTEEREVRARSTETYDSADAADGIVGRVRTEAPGADLIEYDRSAYQVYEGETGTYSWRLIDEDGTVMADSSQGEYETEDDATAEFEMLQEYAPDAERLKIENSAFELFEDDTGWGWRLVDDIGEEIAEAGDRHDEEDGARDSMNQLIETVSDVDARRMEAGAFQVYDDAEDDWWWRFVVPDGTVIATSPGSFGTRHAAEDAAADIQEIAGTAPVKNVGQLAILLDPVDWHWDLVDAHREPVAEGEIRHRDKEGAIDHLEVLQRNANETTVYEIRTAAFDCYRSEEGWTWRLVDDDHDPIATSPETYESLEATEAAVERARTLAGRVGIVDFDDVAFEVFEGEEGWRWRFIDEDRRVIATGAERYEDRAAVEDDLEAVRAEIAAASVIEIDSAAFEFHQTDEGWRWRLVDDAGEEIAESIATFPSRAAAQEDLTTLKELAPEGWVSVAE